MRHVVYGALAGLAATMAMTATAEQLRRFLPTQVKYPLPPREITQRGLEIADIHASTKAVLTTAMIAHFLYGGLAGGVFPVLTKARSPLLGGGYGLAVWVVSYLGWIPAVGLLSPATRHPWRRNVLMLAVHAVWELPWLLDSRRLSRLRPHLVGVECLMQTSASSPALRCRTP